MGKEKINATDHTSLICSKAFQNIIAVYGPNYHSKILLLFADLWDTALVCGLVDLIAAACLAACLT